MASKKTWKRRALRAVSAQSQAESRAEDLEVANEVLKRTLRNVQDILHAMGRLTGPAAPTGHTSPVTVLPDEDDEPILGNPVIEGTFEMPTTDDLEKWGRTGEPARG